MHACESSILEVEAGVSEVQGQHWLHETSREGGGPREEERGKEGAVLVSVRWSGDRVNSTGLASGIPFITLLQTQLTVNF